MAPRACRGQGGQAAVEVALVLPLVALLLLLVAQAALVVRDQVLVVHAAREAALAAAALEPTRLDVRVGPGRQVTVTVSYRTAPFAPMIRGLLPDLVVRGRASMRREF